MSYSSSTVMVQPHTITLAINFSLSDCSISSMKWSNAGWCYKMCTTCIRKVQRQCKQLQKIGLADMALWHLLTLLIVKNSRMALQCSQLTLSPWLHSARMLQKPNYVPLSPSNESIHLLLVWQMRHDYTRAHPSGNLEGRATPSSVYTWCS